MKLAQVLIFSMIFLILIPALVLPSFADNSYLNSTISSLKPFNSQTKSVSVFYPIFFFIVLAVFMVYALKNREDKVASFFTIGAMILCIVLTFMFFSPIQYTFSSNVSQITVEQNQLVNSLVNSTSVIKTSNESIIIPNDQQFRFIIANFFSVMALLNGLLTILIITKWGTNG